MKAKCYHEINTQLRNDMTLEMWLKGKNFPKMYAEKLHKIWFSTTFFKSVNVLGFVQPMEKITPKMV